MLSYFNKHQANFELGSVSLIMPLYIIAIEKANSMAVRQFATDQLRYLGATKGLRKAGILSETARERLR